MKTGKRIVSLLIGFLLLGVFAFSGDIPYELKAMHQFLVGLKTELQEKIYLQTDREVYEAGEVVWFRAWQVSAATHVEPGFSRFLYVELVDKQDSVLDRVKIPYRDSLFAGYLVLDEKLEQGNYYLRSYSRWMQNLGEDFIFKKKISVLKLKGAGTEAVKQKKDKNQKEDFDIRFFPEGGHLLAGNTQVVAFKAIGSDGLGEEVKLCVYNSRDELQCSAQSIHKGMGKFDLTVLTGEHYYALVETEGGVNKRVELPVAESWGVGLEIQLTDSCLVYRVLCGDSTDFPENLYLLGHVRGVPVPELCKPLVHRQGKIHLATFPEGILQVLLADTVQVYSQRLCFVRKNFRPEIEVATDLKRYQPRQAVVVDIQLKNKGNVPLTGNLAVSVLDNAWSFRDTLQDNIVSYLLLSSDLKGYIEDPAWYFAEDTAGRKEALDVLLLTQGWTRFKVEKILRGIPSSPLWSMELGQRISGRVEHFWSKKKDKRDVSLILFGGNGYLEELNPDSTGHFELDGLAFPEGTRFVIQGRTAKGKSSVAVTVDEEKFLQPHIAKISPKTIVEQKEDFNRLYSGDYYYDEQGEKVYLLEEAVVKQKVYPKVQQALYDYKSDFILDSARLASMQDASLKSVVEELPGIEMDLYNKSFLRMGKGIPVIVDHVMVMDMDAEFERLESMQGRDVLRVNLLDKVAGRTLYGSDNGVLVITTRPFRSRVYEPLNRVVFVPMGYQLGAEFYMPRYDVDSVRLAMQNQIDKRKTVYWNPQVRVDGNGCARFSFFTSDSGGPYFLRMEGILDDGTLCRKEQKIEF